MSEYAESVWRAFYKTIGRSFLIPNGVDKDLFYPREKDTNYLIFASAPNRGLKRLPLIFEAIKSRTGLPVYMKAFSNMSALHPNETGDEFALDYKSCEEAGIERRDPVPQPELAEELGRAGLMILPTDYPEICSNIILQSLASGTPIITTGNLGSAGEWIRDGKNGRLTKFQVHDYMIHTVEIVRMAVEVLNDPARHRRMMKAATETKIDSWEMIGAKWERMIQKLS
jgi:glycosyltransferase involved in cell wall biosynthesis